MLCCCVCLLTFLVMEASLMYCSCMWDVDMRCVVVVEPSLQSRSGGIHADRRVEEVEVTVNHGAALHLLMSMVAELRFAQRAVANMMLI
mmetsp:Transcript_9664/g.24155  ORF Transcript_9664/g.24155 Transcript_9664/m.24155 type:complete len:89 (+) Transcript_9664:71-337(+)